MGLHTENAALTSAAHALEQWGYWCVPGEPYGDQRIGISHKERSNKDLTLGKSCLKYNPKAFISLIFHNVFLFCNAFKYTEITSISYVIKERTWSMAKLYVNHILKITFFFYLNTKVINKADLREHILLTSKRGVTFLALTVL